MTAYDGLLRHSYLSALNQHQHSRRPFWLRTSRHSRLHLLPAIFYRHSTLTFWRAKNDGADEREEEDALD
jgi:hypothetical protein